MFTTWIVQPIFNVLVLIYALLPGHNFGLSVIIFTIVVRLLMWPLVKKQLRQAKIMRELQPELKAIKKKAGGDRVKEAAMLTELYKERGVSPMGSIGILIPQMIILIGLYSGLRRVVDNPDSLITFSYAWLQHLPWLKDLAGNIHMFDDTLFGVVNLTRAASGAGGVYWPAMFLVFGSAVAQFYQSRQIMPNSKQARTLKQILKATANGEEVDSAERNAATMRFTSYLMPAMIFLFTVGLPAALSLYWMVGGIVAIIQQAIVLREDEEEMEELADKPERDLKAIPEAEVVEVTAKPEEPGTKTKKPTKNKAKAHKHKRRKR